MAQSKDKKILKTVRRMEETKKKKRKRNDRNAFYVPELEVKDEQRWIIVVVGEVLLISML